MSQKLDYIMNLSEVIKNKLLGLKFKDFCKIFLKELPMKLGAKYLFPLFLLIVLIDD